MAMASFGARIDVAGPVHEEQMRRSADNEEFRYDCRPLSARVSTDSTTFSFEFDYYVQFRIRQIPGNTRCRVRRIRYIGRTREETFSHKKYKTHCGAS